MSMTLVRIMVAYNDKKETKQLPATTRSESDKPKLSARRLAHGAADSRASKAHADFRRQT
jgi:hypothetical protein